MEIITTIIGTVTGICTKMGLTKLLGYKTKTKPELPPASSIQDLSQKKGDDIASKNIVGDKGVINNNITNNNTNYIIGAKDNKENEGIALESLEKTSNYEELILLKKVNELDHYLDKFKKALIEKQEHGSNSESSPELEDK